MNKKAVYLSNKEYEKIFINFCSLRQKVIEHLKNFGILKSKYIMDLLAGHGFLSFALREANYDKHLIDIGLRNDLDSFKKTIAKGQFNFKNVQYNIMDSSKLGFRNECINFIINFLGFEDVNMTKGKFGVISTLSEIVRVLQKGGFLEIAILIKNSEPSSILFWQIWKYIGLNSIFYPPKFYIHQLRKLNCSLEAKFLLKTYKKMNFEQAKEEILFACEEAPKIFKNFDVTSKSFQEVWDKFGANIKKYGLGFYPDILVLIFKRY